MGAAGAIAHRGLALACLGLLFVGWAIFLGGVASLQQVGSAQERRPRHWKAQQEAWAAAAAAAQRRRLGGTERLLISHSPQPAPFPLLVPHRHAPTRWEQAQSQPCLV